MFDEEFNPTQEDVELLKRLRGYNFNYIDLTFAIFENKSTFPHSISFLIKMPLQGVEAGVIIVTNPDRGTYSQRACKNRVILDKVYRIAKRKILSRGGLSLGYEGACILNGFEKLN